MKTKANTSFDVSYAEIFAEVQKLQRMLDGKSQSEPKQRKKRTVKSKIDQPSIDTPIGDFEAYGNEESVENMNQSQEISEDQTPKSRYKVSNLDEIREKINEVKDLIQEADPEAAATVEELDANTIQSTSPVEAEKIEEQPEAKAEIFETTLDVVEENKDIAIEPEAQVTIGDVEVKEQQPDEPVVEKPVKEVSKAKKTTAASSKPKKPATKSAAQAKADLDAYFLDPNDTSPKEGKLVGLAEERHAAQLAKHGVSNKDEIIKADLEHDKSGAEWGGAVNLEEDPDLEHPNPQP